MGTNAGDTIRQLLALSGSMDVEGLARLLAPDVVMELPYAPEPLPRRATTGSTRCSISSGPRAGALLVLLLLEVDRVLVVDGGRSVVAEYRSEGVAAGSGLLTATGTSPSSTSMPAAGAALAEFPRPPRRPGSLQAAPGRRIERAIPFARGSTEHGAGERSTSDVRDPLRTEREHATMNSGCSLLMVGAP